MARCTLEMMGRDTVHNNPETKQIGLGSKVAVIFDTRAALTVTIKNPKEIDPQNGVVSHESPIGKALLNKREGEEFQYIVGDRTFKGKISKVFGG